MTGRRRVEVDWWFATATLLLAVGIIGLIHGWVGATYVGSALLTGFVAKLAVAYRARVRDRHRWQGPAPASRVCIVMPVRNEDPGTRRPPCDRCSRRHACRTGSR